jgi:hypothetical protein
VATAALTARATLLGVSSATGILSGRALDGLGLLPGVHESEQVRQIALAPSWTAAGLVASLLLGVLADLSLTRLRSRLLTVAVLVGGQLVVLATPELLGRAGHGSGEAPLYVAVAVQLLLSVLTVSTAVAVRRLTGSIPTTSPGLALDTAVAGTSSYRVVLLPLRCGGLGGRAPPGRVLH